MRGWDFPVSIDPQASLPIFAQIARAIAGDIRRGRLRAGEPMPSTRTLARTLGVNRNTVIAAYDDLAAEGWVTTENGRGTFVSRTLPDPRPRRFATVIGSGATGDVEPFDLGPGIHVERCPSGLSTTYNLAGWPDLRLVPTKAIARAWRRSIERRTRQVLSYGPAGGHPRLRAALASMLSATRGLAIDESRLLVTRGTQGALAVIAHGVLRPDDVVAMENPGYQRARHAFALAGARIVPVPVDAHGLCTDHLAALVREQPVRAVFVTPHHQFPTTVTLSPARRLRLLELAREHRFADYRGRLRPRVSLRRSSHIAVGERRQRRERHLYRQLVEDARPRVASRLHCRLRESDCPPDRVQLSPGYAWRPGARVCGCGAA